MSLTVREVKTPRDAQNCAESLKLDHFEVWTGVEYVYFAPEEVFQWAFQMTREGRLGEKLQPLSMLVFFRRLQ